uniref:Uncharacterized protein n=1 Tax=Panagrellus redivivus TaxID=6233 RepID=A0A7E4W819_PANRE
MPAMITDHTLTHWIEGQTTCLAFYDRPNALLFIPLFFESDLIVFQDVHLRIDLTTLTVPDVFFLKLLPICIDVYVGQVISSMFPHSLGILYLF